MALARAGRALGWGVLRDHPLVGLSAESGIPTFRGAGGLWEVRSPLVPIPLRICS